ncbi:MAG: winged helix-turn-helix transcriptional regulator, partial [Opitutales bacterium]|nr:winged helix-turn-helix transcriptional regulator [Opitutales bacterium]
EPSASHKTLSDSNWLLIFHALTHAPYGIAKIATLVGLKKSTVADHLTVLLKAEIIVDEHRDQQVLYSLRKPCLNNLFSWLENFNTGSSV